MEKFNLYFYPERCEDAERLKNYHKLMNETVKKTTHGFLKFSSFIKYKEQTDHLYEGLIKTVHRNDVAKYLNKHIQDLISGSEIEGENKVTSEFILMPKHEFKNTLIKDMNNLGYFVQCIENDIISFAAKYDFDATDTIYRHFDLKLYHLSPILYKNKILKNGLYPKSQSKLSYHTERIYFSLHKNFDINFIQKMYDSSKNKDKFNSYCIYEIDLAKCAKKKFMYDVNCENAVYTMENIPPQCITLIEEFNVNE